jgi:hypothetical protein
MRIVFFNHFNNGDIHVSRSFIKNIIPKIKSIIPDAEFIYSHKNPNLLIDIDGLKYDPSIYRQVKNEHVGVFKIGESIYFNTWYAQQHHKFMNVYGLTLDCLYAAFDSNCKEMFGFSLDDISIDLNTFFPTIDYSKFELSNVNRWLELTKNQKKIFISNGPVLSGQSNNFNLTKIIDDIAKNNLDKIFILSNPESIISPNIIFSSNIINKVGCDLNENAYLSTFCDLIIGRASGAFTFAMDYKNFIERSIDILCFSDLTNLPSDSFWLSSLFKDKIKYSANIENYNNYDLNFVRSAIEEKVAKTMNKIA